MNGSINMYVWSVHAFECVGYTLSDITLAGTLDTTHSEYRWYRAWNVGRRTQSNEASDEAVPGGRSGVERKSLGYGSQALRCSRGYGNANRPWIKKRCRARGYQVTGRKERAERSGGQRETKHGEWGWIRLDRDSRVREAHPGAWQVRGGSLEWSWSLVLWCYEKLDSRVLEGSLRTPDWGRARQIMEWSRMGS